MNKSNLKNYLFTSARPIIVFDAGALLTGIDISNLAVDNFCFTTRNIFEEEIKNKDKKTTINSYIVSQTLILLETNPRDFREIELFSDKSGDLRTLSVNDKGILALCLYLRRSYKKQFDTFPNLTLITDDYSVQNVAKLSGITTKPYKYKGIKKYIQWEVYCKVCYKIYPPDMFGKECYVCGEIVKRRPKKRRTKKK